MSAKLRVAAEFVVQALALPYGTRIVGGVYDSHEYTFTLDVEHDSIPASAEEVTAICRSVACHFEPIKKV